MKKPNSKKTDEQHQNAWDNWAVTKEELTSRGGVVSP